jgi:hypothetical protein
MKTHSIVPHSSFFFVLTLVTGIAYPLVVTGIAQSLFPAQAERQPDHPRRQARGLGADRPELQRAEALLGSSIRHQPDGLQRRRRRAGPTRAR